jgi:hypothetical protein
MESNLDIEIISIFQAIELPCGIKKLPGNVKLKDIPAEIPGQCGKQGDPLLCLKIYFG